MDDIRGKSDIDLVNAFRERTGKVHSYGELCHSTDEIIKKTKKAGHFIEMGYIDKELYILDAYKRPIIDIKGNFVGSEGYAFNRGASAKLFEGMIQYGIEHGCLKVLDIVDDQAAVYEILDVCPSTAFLSGFPAQ
jgi:hypothetical protein